MKFSVIIPTYNQGPLLQKALESVENQSYKNFETIIINNYSDDNTLEVIKNSNIQNIKVINFSNGGVIAASRNIGVQESSGEYICFLDSDDEWLPKKLEEIDIVTRSQTHQIISHSENWLYPNGTIKKKTYGPSTSFKPKALIFKKNCLSTSAVTISKTLFTSLGGFNEQAKFVLAEDYELWIRAALKGEKCFFIDDILGIFRVHADGNSRKIKIHLAAEMSVINKHKNSVDMSYIEFIFQYFKRISRAYIGSFLRYYSIR